jgi:hypothetical protein
MPEFAPRTFWIYCEQRITATGSSPSYSLSINIQTILHIRLIYHPRHGYWAHEQQQFQKPHSHPTTFSHNVTFSHNICNIYCNIHEHCSLIMFTFICTHFKLSISATYLQISLCTLWKIFFKHKQNYTKKIRQ